MAAQHGHKKAGGRQKGVPNKLTYGGRAAIQDAFEKMGGVQGLLSWGQENPSEFYKLWGQKLVSNAPQDLNIGGQEDNPVQHSHKVIFECLSGNVLRKAD